MTVNATDPDNDPDGEIIYYLDEERKKNNDWKSFNIDSKSGVLTLNTKLNLNKLKGDTRQHDMVVDGKYLRNKHKLEYEIQGIKAYPETTREAKAQPEQPRTAQPRNLKNTNIDLNKNTA